MAAIFVCIVQPKVIEFNVSDQKLHRAQKDEELRFELDALQLPSDIASAAAAAPSQGPYAASLCQPGGGCRILSVSVSVSVASVGSAVCVFEGALTNAVALAEDYVTVSEDEPTSVSPALSNAQLICHLYSKVGVELLALLRGTFTFVLYESKTSRVLAARDGTGRTPLFQARTATGSLMLTNSEELLIGSGAADKLELLPGDYKYGWSAAPRRYQPADPSRLPRRSPDHPSVQNDRFHGHPNGHNYHGSSCNGSVRGSLDVRDISSGSTRGAAATEGRPLLRNRSQQSPPYQQHQSASGRNGSVLPGSPSPPHPQRHGYHVLSPEDVRILKPDSNKKKSDLQAAVATGAAPFGTQANTPVKGPSAAWTASAAVAVPGPKGKDRNRCQEQEVGDGVGGGTPRRGDSTRSAAFGHHNQRRNMDSHGSWRLGSAAGVSASNRQPPTVQEDQEQQLQQQDDAKKQQSPGSWKAQSLSNMDGRSFKQHAQQKKQLQKQESATPPGALSARKQSAVSADGPPSARGVSLRGDAPEFVCTRAAAVTSPITPVAI